MAKAPDTPRSATLKRSDLSLTSALSSRSSTFKSLLSSKNVKEKSLPRFLREERKDATPVLALPFGPAAAANSLGSLHSAEEMNLLTSHFATLSPRSMFSQMAPPKPFRASRDMAAELQRKKEARIEELLNDLRQEEADGSEVLFTIKEQTFTRTEMRKLVLNGEVTRKVMQAYFKHLNHENRKSLDIQSVKIFSIAFTQEIFGKGRASVLHSRADPLKYE